MKKLEKRTNLPEFQLDDLALEDRRSKLLEFDGKRRLLARNRSLDQHVRNTARNLAGYVSDRLYMCEQARRYVGLVRRRDTPLGEPLRKRKLKFSPGAVRHVWQRFLSFDGRWAVHSNIRRWRQRISKIRREAATVNRMLDRLGIEIDPAIRPEACLHKGWATNGTAKTSMSPQATTELAANNTIKSVLSDDKSRPETIPNSVGPDSRDEMQDRSIENPPQHTDTDVAEDAAHIAFDPSEPAVGVGQETPSNCEKGCNCLAFASDGASSVLDQPPLNAGHMPVVAVGEGRAADDIKCQSPPSLDRTLTGAGTDIDLPDQPAVSPSPSVLVNNNIQMPATISLPIQIVLQSQHASRDSEARQDGKTDREDESSDDERGPKWGFELNLNSLPQRIKFGGNTYEKKNPEYERDITGCDSASEKQILCAVLNLIYEVPIMELEKGLGIHHSTIRKHIEKCGIHMKSQGLWQKIQKNRAKGGMDGDSPGTSRRT